MEETSEANFTILKSVLVVAIVFTAVCLAWVAAVYLVDVNPPSASGVVTTILSTYAGAAWFRSKLVRPMTRRERLWFAAGVTLINSIGPVILIGILIVWAGLPLTPASYDLALAGGKGYLFDPIVGWFVIFALTFVFAQAYFVGGRATRKQKGRRLALEQQ